MPESPTRPAQPPGRRRDIGGAVGCVLAVIIGAAAIWNARNFSALGAVFPRTMSALMIALALLFLVLVLMGRTRPAEPAGGSNWRRAGVAVVILAWAYLLVPLGFLGASAAAIVALLVIANHNPWTPRTVLGYGISAAFVLAAFYVVFKHVLQVPLP